MIFGQYRTQTYVSLLCILLAGCSSSEKDDPSNKTAKQLYDEAIAEYNDKNYDDASKKFSDLEKEYPFSKFTKDGLLKTAYSQYESEEYESSASTLTRYMDLYPGSDKSDYALYLLSMCYYNQISDPRRDQEVVLLAQKYLNELINRYPNSDHTVDGKIKLDFVNNQIAAKEMIIGRFYLQNEQTTAAINRFKQVVKKHQTTVHVKEALYRLTESYLLLGLNKPAYRAAALLGHNYPDSEWYHLAYDLIKENDPNFSPEKITSNKQEESWWKSIL